MIRLGVITLSIILFGCGGGGGGASSGASIGPTIGSTSSTGPVTISGSVQDGYISGALVFIDTNGNYVQDAGEITSTTNERGEFSLTYPSGAPSGFLLSVGGIDLDSNIKDDNLIYVKKNFDSSNTNIISPLTSVASYLSNPEIFINILGLPSSDGSLNNGSYESVEPVKSKSKKLYRVANRLSVLSKILRDITNDQKNFTSSDTKLDSHIFFQLIAKRFEQNYSQFSVKVDSVEFIEPLLLDLETDQNIQINNKSNLSIAISNALSLIQHTDNKPDFSNKIITWANSEFLNDMKIEARANSIGSILDLYKNDIFNYVASSSAFNGSAYGPSQIIPLLRSHSNAVTIDEDTQITIDVLANNEFMSSYYPYTLSILEHPENGLASIVNNKILYTPNANFYGVDEINLTFSQNFNSTGDFVTITITPVNDAPEIGIALPITVNENQTTIKTLLFSDVDSAAELITTSLSGTDASYFNYTSAGVLSFKEAQDYESKNSFSITITATDGTSERSYNAIVQLINLNDNGPAIPTRAFAINENTTTVTSSLATDADGGALNYSLSGTDAAAFSVSSLGVLTFNTALTV